jgi:hypothetical protein
MKLKKLFTLTLSILFVATLSAQTKKVATNKLIKTLEKNKKTGVTFVSDINLNGIEVLENQTLVIPSLKNETINFVAKIDTEFLIERIKYKNSQLFKVEFVLQNENTKTYEISLQPKNTYSFNSLYHHIAYTSSLLLRNRAGNVYQYRK